jgi:futalosine hydrolase
MRVLVCTATPLESAWLRTEMPADGTLEYAVTGVGPVNAAHAVTQAILVRRPDAVVLCGIAGAYPSAGLTVGDVVCASEECYGDLGAQSPQGFLDMQALGFPVIAGPPAYYNRLPLHVFPVTQRVRHVTVSTCTGTDADARAIEARTGGAVENMEGAAVAHVGLLHGVPVGQVRGISNIVTTRNPREWRIHDAALAAQKALAAWLTTR